MCKRILYRAAQSTEKRADDNEETIKTRLATFRTNTNEILSQYKDKTVIVSFYLIHFSLAKSSYIPLFFVDKC